MMVVVLPVGWKYVAAVRYFHMVQTLIGETVPFLCMGT